MTLTGIVLPWVFLGSPIPDAGVRLGVLGDHGGLGGHVAGSPEVLPWLDTGPVFCSSGDPSGTPAVRKATKELSSPLPEYFVSITALDFGRGKGKSSPAGEDVGMWDHKSAPWMLSWEL